MAKELTQSEESKTGTRERIVRVAAELFARKGYHATGVEELSAAVNLARGALYYHIGSKEDLLWDILWLPAKELADFASALPESSVDPELRLRHFARALMSGIANNLDPWTVFFREFHGLTDERLAVVLKLREEFESELWNVLEEGHAQGLFKAVDPLLAKGLLGMFNYSYLWIRPHGTRTPEEIADLFCDVVLDGILVPDNGAQRPRP